MKKDFLEIFYNEKYNHFIQIQKIANIISRDKNTIIEFLKLQSLDQKYNYAQNKYKELFFEPYFSKDEYRKFEFLSDIFHQIGKDEQLSNKIDQITDKSNLYKFMEKFIKNQNPEYIFDKSDFEKFLYATSMSSELVCQNELKNVAAGMSGESSGGKDFMDIMLEYDQRATLMYGLGMKIGGLIKKIISLS